MLLLLVVFAPFVPETRRLAFANANIKYYFYLAPRRFVLPMDIHYLHVHTGMYVCTSSATMYEIS